MTRNLVVVFTAANCRPNWNARNSNRTGKVACNHEASIGSESVGQIDERHREHRSNKTTSVSKPFELRTSSIPPERPPIALQGLEAI